jgi:hypothetical protein
MHLNNMDKWVAKPTKCIMLTLLRFIKIELLTKILIILLELMELK